MQWTGALEVLSAVMGSPDSPLFLVGLLNRNRTHAREQLHGLCGQRKEMLPGRLHAFRGYALNPLIIRQMTESEFFNEPE
jgi:hypothetical protein